MATLNNTYGITAPNPPVIITGRGPILSANVEQNLCGFANLSTSCNLQSSAITLKVSSSSANDTSAGTGARTITITGLDANFDSISEVVTMNGQTPVTTTNAFLRVHFVTIKACGSLMTNAGDIWVSISTEASYTAGVPQTTSYMQAMAPAGYGRAFIGHFTVPRNRTLTICQITTTVVGPINPDFSSIIHLYGEIYGEGMVSRAIIPSTENGVGLLDLHLAVPYVVEPKTTIHIRGQATHTTNVTLGGIVFGSIELA